MHAGGGEKNDDKVKEAFCDWDSRKRLRQQAGLQRALLQKKVIAGPGVGHAGAVAAVSAGCCAAAGTTTSQARVLSFQDSRFSFEFHCRTENSRRLLKCIACFSASKCAATREPVDVQGVQLPQERSRAEGYIVWFAQFRAREFFDSLPIWGRTFAQHQELLPCSIKKRIPEVYSVWSKVLPVQIVPTSMISCVTLHTKLYNINKHKFCTK